MFNICDFKFLNSIFFENFESILPVIFHEYIKLINSKCEIFAIILTILVESSNKSILPLIFQYIKIKFKMLKKFLLIIFNNSCGEKFKISLKRRDPLRNTFAYLSPSERRRGAGSSSPGVGVNRYDQPRPRYEKSTFVISRLVEFARFAVTGPSAARSPRLRLLSRGWSNAAIPKNTLELGDHLGVRLPVFVLPRRRLASSIAGPVHATLSPTGLVEKLHGPPSSRVRVQQ